jgi:hypothetical protein
MITQNNVNLVTIIVISIGLIFLGGSFFYLHNSIEDYESNPIFWSLGVGLASTGSAILVGLILKAVLPFTVYTQLIDLKKK